MKKTRAIYTLKHAFSAVFMITALLWLTVSSSFVFQSQLQLKKIQKERMADLPPASPEKNNPLTNTTEEKAPSSVSVSEEYLHHTSDNEHPWFSIIRHHRDYSTSLYVAYHGELFCPPPNA
jgi:hypothetical protein